MGLEAASRCWFAAWMGEHRKSGGKPPHSENDLAENLVRERRWPRPAAG
jgi:hypothetical protein